MTGVLPASRRRLALFKTPMENIHGVVVENLSKNKNYSFTVNVSFSSRLFAGSGIYKRSERRWTWRGWRAALPKESAEALHVFRPSRLFD